MTVLHTQAGPLDLSLPTAQFYHTRERVRDCLEKNVSMYNSRSYKFVASRVGVDPRTAKRHVEAIRRENEQRSGQK